MGTTNNILSTVSQRVLNFLIQHPSSTFLEKQITRGAHTKRSATNITLKGLAAKKLIKAQKRGRSTFYSIDLADALIRSLKLKANIALLRPLVDSLKSFSERIILFGSASEGTNLENSDFDVFLVTPTPEAARKVLATSKLRNKLQLIIKRPSDLPVLRKKDPDFYREIDKGFILFEKKDES